MSVGKKFGFINRVGDVNWPPYRDWVLALCIHPDEGLTLEMSAFRIPVTVVNLHYQLCW